MSAPPPLDPGTGPRAPQRRPSKLTVILGLVAIVFAIAGGVLGILKGAILVTIGIGLALFGLVFAAWALQRAVRRADTFGMLVGAIASIATFFASIAGALTLFARIVAHDL